jgi:hypothetical protein
VDDETIAAFAAMEARIVALMNELATLKPRAEQENTITLVQYAKRIGFSRESARRRLLADPRLGQKIGGRWRVTP